MTIEEFVLNGCLFLESLDGAVCVYKDTKPDACLEEAREEAREEAAQQAADLGADNVTFVGDDASVDRLTLSVSPGVALALDRLAAARECTRGDVLKDALVLFCDAINAAHGIT